MNSGVPHPQSVETAAAVISRKRFHMFGSDFDARYAEWAAAEGEVLLAMESPHLVGAEQLAVLCARAADLHRKIWAQPDGRSD